MRVRLHRDAAASVNLLITLAAMAASVALALTLPHTLAVVGARPGEVAAFLALTLALQLASVEVYGRGSISVSAIGLLASGFALGPAPAMAIGVMAALLQWIRKRGLLHRAIFDAANYSLSAGAAALVFHLLLTVDRSTPARLAAATLAGALYSGINNVLLCLAMGLSESLPLRVVWLERFHWARFHFLAYGPLALASTIAYDNVGVIGVLAFTLPPALLLFSVRQYLERTRSAVEEVRQANLDLRRVNIELRELAEHLRRTHRDTIAALSRSMEAKDYDTSGHTERVSGIAVALARRLGYEGEELEAIEIGALLHDIGKIGIPEHILHKPAPLDEEEWQRIRQHPLISEFILAGVDLHPFVCQIARSSHERLDGDGYPDGLAGEEIPLPARIVLVADAYDAITSDRPYRPRRAAGEALAELRAGAGTQLCPRVLEAFESLYREEPNVLRDTILRAVEAA